MSVDDGGGRPPVLLTLAATDGPCGGGGRASVERVLEVVGDLAEVPGPCELAGEGSDVCFEDDRTCEPAGEKARQAGEIGDDPVLCRLLDPGRMGVPAVRKP